MTKAEKTRRYIIEKAAPLFNKKGMAGTSISDIMEVTSLAKGGIYGNFTTKEEISVEVFDYMMEEVMETLRGVTAPEITSRGKLVALLEFYRQYPIKPIMGGGCPILNFGVEADDTNPLMRKRVGEAILEMQQSIEKLVQRGIRYGEFEKGWDGRAFGIRMFALLQGGIFISRVQGNNEQMSLIIDVLEKEIDENLT